MACASSSSSLCVTIAQKADFFPLLLHEPETTCILGIVDHVVGNLDASIVDNLTSNIVQKRDFLSFPSHAQKAMDKNTVLKIYISQ